MNPLHLEHHPDAAGAAAGARARGAEPHIVDGSELTDKTGTLAAIAKALSFPDYFGGNLDALYDSATDLSWLPEGEQVLVWSHANRLRDADAAGFRGIAATLSDAVAASRRGTHPLRVVLTDS
jgi:RNAse (barnase) inhibitor barstar